MRRALAPLLLAALGSAARGPVLARSPPAGRQRSVARLLVDIDQSLRSTQGDAEMVFASLFSHEHQLEESLAREMTSMEEALSKLSMMRTTYLNGVQASRDKVQKLHDAARGSGQNASRDQAAAADMGEKVASALASAVALARLLRNAEVTPEGALLTPGAPDDLDTPTKVYDAIRRLLTTHRAMSPGFSDVFFAFEGDADPPGDGALTTESTPLVRMTPVLLKRTVVVLSAIQTRLRSQKGGSLLELAGQEDGRAALAQAKEAEQQGLQAEEEHAVEELSFSMAFSETVLGMDKDMRATVEKVLKSKADLIERIRLSRQSQLKALKDLLDLMHAKDMVAEEETPEASPSFLEVTSRGGYPKESLLFEIETALRHKADTHGILLRIKGSLDEAKAADATSAFSVVKELVGVLQTMDNDQSRAYAAKRRCEAQRSHAVHGEQDLKANLELMNSVQKHTGAAMTAARSNLKHIVAKARGLQSSAKAFSRAVSRALETLRRQSSDRATIIAAVRRAGSVMAESGGAGARAAALLDKMHKELEAQEQWERDYRSEESALQNAYLKYIRGYLEILHERKAHYERSLSALELYSSEVAGDVAAQSNALSTSGELATESQDLCDGILKFYASFVKRRFKVIDTLKDLLPRMPELVRGGANDTDAPDPAAGDDLP